MRISARNQLKGKIKSITAGAVNCEVVIELAGGAQALADRAKAHNDAGRPLEALHLVGIALNADPDNRAALEVKKAASQALLQASGGKNLSETMWLKSEIAEIDEKLGS